jgi:hypothetical protein
MASSDRQSEAPIPAPQTGRPKQRAQKELSRSLEREQQNDNKKAFDCSIAPWHI